MFYDMFSDKEDFAQCSFHYDELILKYHYENHMFMETLRELKFEPCLQLRAPSGQKKKKEIIEGTINHLFLSPVGKFTDTLGDYVFPWMQHV